MAELIGPTYVVGKQENAHCYLAARDLNFGLLAQPIT